MSVSDVYARPLLELRWTLLTSPSTRGTAFLAMDLESKYEPHLTLTYRWNPENLGEEVRMVRGTELYAYGERSEYVCVLHVATSNLAENPKGIPRRR